MSKHTPRQVGFEYGSNSKSDTPPQYLKTIFEKHRLAQNAMTEAEFVEGFKTARNIIKARRAKARRGRDVD